MKTSAIAYLRTSSVANLDGDSEHRQREAIKRYAKANAVEIVAEFYDKAVSGADPIETRKGFSDMLSEIEGNGVRLVVVEDASRLARSVLVAELAILVMAQHDVRIVTASGEDLTATDDPARVMMRQVAQAFSQYEKARLVAKLQGARDRKSAALGRRIEGRKSYIETRPEMVREAKRLARKSPKTRERRSLREIAAELAKAGFMTSKGKPLSAAMVKRLCSVSVRGPDSTMSEARLTRTHTPP
jgi:DNA invertase Pin-like site-specific DNA recombinase